MAVPVGAAEPDAGNGLAARLALVAAAVAAVSLVVAVVTGVVLGDRYRPVADPFGVPAGSDLATVEALRDWHRASALVAIAATVTLAATAGRRVGTARRSSTVQRGTLVAVGGLVVALATLVLAAITGGGLAWEQLALRQVAVGAAPDGVWDAAFGDGVVFVVIDAATVSQGAYRARVLIHALVLPALAVTAMVVAVVGLRQVVRRR